MNIAVLIKQVPAGSANFDRQSGLLERSASKKAINPWDLYAIEAALQTGEKLQAQITAITMGPLFAQEVLRDALAMGVHQAVLLQDKAFAGADVYATAYTLAQGIKALGGFDLIFCGQQTTDGDTAQLPPSLAVQLGAYFAGWTKKIEQTEQKELTFLQELSGGTQRIHMHVPLVAAVGREVAQPRIPTLKNRLKAKSVQIRILSLGELPCSDAKWYGLAASPTRVIKVYENIETAKTPPLCLTPKQAAGRIHKEVEELRHGS